MNAQSLKCVAVVATIAIAASLGGCKKPVASHMTAVPVAGSDSPAAGSGGGAAGKASTPVGGGGGGVAYCDCSNVSAGLLTREYQNQCRARETQLKQLAAACGSDVGSDLACTSNALKLKAGPDGKLASGEFCDSVARGDAAWPVEGGPQVPPPHGAEKKPCTKVSGLSRECQ